MPSSCLGFPPPVPCPPTPAPGPRRPPPRADPSVPCPPPRADPRRPTPGPRRPPPRADTHTRSPAPAPARRPLAFRARPPASSPACQPPATRARPPAPTPARRRPTPGPRLRFMIMDREWMYKTSRLDASYLDHVTRFIVAAKSCKNLLANEDNVVKSHLVWEAEDPSVGASGGISSTMTTTVNVEQQPSPAVVGDNTDRDYITMDDQLQDMADDDSGDGDGGEPAGVMKAKDVELFEELANR
ncbi:uncharacterized protein [Miscanthus floridulus]|uniref:uncharacterized protein n=1 Tax=Miscanthus floridulus TaxID=154761 RepID=UPI00345A70EB